MAEVDNTAEMVPDGIDFWASLRSPDMLEPVMIPETHIIVGGLMTAILKVIYWQTGLHLHVEWQVFNKTQVAKWVIRRICNQ